MVAFTRTDIPATVDTVEKLAVWVETLLNNLFPNETAVESTGTAERICQAAPFYFTASNPPAWRYVSRHSIAMSPNFQRAGKIWEHAQAISTTATIPPDFKA